MSRPPARCVRSDGGAVPRVVRAPGQRGPAACVAPVFRIPLAFECFVSQTKRMIGSGYTLSERDSDDWNCPESQGWQEVIAFLEHCSRPAKRARNSMSMEERAAQVGVLNRLKPIPETLRASAAKGSEDAKRQLQKLQIANQQIVSRAEKQAEKKQK